MKVQNEHTSGQDSSSSCPSDNTSIPHHQPLHYSVQSMPIRNNARKENARCNSYEGISSLQTCSKNILRSKRYVREKENTGSYLVGKPIRLYCDVGKAYHTGRIVDFRPASKPRLYYTVSQAMTSIQKNKSTDMKDVREPPATFNGKLKQSIRENKPKTELDHVQNINVKNAAKSLPSKIKYQNNVLRALPITPHEEYGDFDTSSTEYLIRFRSGVEGRGIPVHRWVTLEEHAIAIGVTLVWGCINAKKMCYDTKHFKTSIGRDNSQFKEKDMTNIGGINKKPCPLINSDESISRTDINQCWQPAQIMLRSALEMVPVQEINNKHFSAKAVAKERSPNSLLDIGDDSNCDSSNNFDAIAFFFGESSPTILQLQTMSTNFFSESFQSYLGALTVQRDQSLTMSIAMACAEYEEQLRVRRYHNLPIDQTVLYSNRLEKEDEVDGLFPEIMRTRVASSVPCENIYEEEEDGSSRVSHSSHESSCYSKKQVRGIGEFNDDSENSIESSSWIYEYPLCHYTSGEMAKTQCERQVNL